jgi:hypothetical protein
MKNIINTISLFVIIVILSISIGFAEKSVNLNTEFGGKKIFVKVNAGKYWEDKWPIFLFIYKTTTPQAAIWIEDNSGKYLKTIYVSQKAATQGWVGIGNIRRKSSLPIWAHKRGVKYQDGIYLPTNDNPLPDALTGATPAGDFVVNIPYDDKIPKKIKIFAEFNSSGNFNKNYPEGEFFGQPSVVYSAVVDLMETGSLQELKLVGHGHPKGENGELFTDLNKLTTAKNIVKEITVKIGEIQ